MSEGTRKATVDKNHAVWKYCDVHKIGYYHECPYCANRRPRESK